jgi:hypothetical protein
MDIKIDIGEEKVKRHLGLEEGEISSPVPKIVRLVQQKLL